MKKQKPDDYFSNGKFEMVRFGRSTFMKNIMSEAENEKYRSKLKAEFPKMKQEINNLILVLFGNPIST